MEHEKFINLKNRIYELNESTVQDQKIQRKSSKILLPSQRHREIQRILMKKYLLAIQRPKITDQDRLIAYNDAKAYLKRLRNDLERRSRGLTVWLFTILILFLSWIKSSVFSAFWEYHLVFGDDLWLRLRFTFIREFQA